MLKRAIEIRQIYNLSSDIEKILFRLLKMGRFNLIFVDCVLLLTTMGDYRRNGPRGIN